MTYNELPVYKIAYDLNLELFGIVKMFERDYKYTLGEKIKKSSLKLIINIYKANRDKNTKLSYLLKAREDIEKIRLMLRIAKDLKIINLKKFVMVQPKIEAISKQLSSWQKYEEKNGRV